MLVFINNNWWIIPLFGILIGFITYYFASDLDNNTKKERKIGSIIIGSVLSFLLYIFTFQITYVYYFLIQNQIFSSILFGILGLFLWRIRGGGKFNINYWHWNKSFDQFLISFIFMLIALPILGWYSLWLVPTIIFSISMGYTWYMDMGQKQDTTLIGSKMNYFVYYPLYLIFGNQQKEWLEEKRILHDFLGFSWRGLINTGAIYLTFYFCGYTMPIWFLLTSFLYGVAYLIPRGINKYFDKEYNTEHAEMIYGFLYFSTYMLWVLSSFSLFL